MALGSNKQTKQLPANRKEASQRIIPFSNCSNARL
jgi:hypothetical protein